MNEYQNELSRLLESESHLNTYSKKEILANIALGFPNTYSTGMASLGYQIVYHLINSSQHTNVERFFLTSKEHTLNIKSILTLETQTPIKNFDVIGFSVSFELDYINLLNILRYSGINLLSKSRGEHEPIIIIGGAITGINPCPISDFADVFLIGDLEDISSELINILLKTKSQPKIEILKELSEIDGIYVPSISQNLPIDKHICYNLDDYTPHSVITTAKAEFGDTVLFETARGCNRGCKFCAAGYTQRPSRTRQPQVPDYKSYGIVGAAIFDNTNSEELCKEFIKNNAHFSLSSIRLETLTENRLKLMKESNIKTVTIAPEAGSEQLRKLIGKSCSDDRILDSLKLIIDSGIRKIKLYFMLGLPYETASDIEAIYIFMKKISSLYPKAHFQMSIGCFVPKPRTPFQWHPMATEKYLKKNINIIKKELNIIKNIDISFESPRMAIIQGILSRLDNETGRQYLLAAMENNYTAANRLFKEEIDNVLFTNHNFEQIFPWDKIKYTVNKDILYRIYKNI